MTNAVSNAAISVRSSNIQLGTVLPARAHQGIVRIALKYLGRLDGASVYFKREGRSYSCTVNIEVGALKIVTGKASGFDCYLALENALKKAAKQFRRMKRTNTKQLRSVKGRSLANATFADAATRPAFADVHVLDLSSRQGSHAVLSPG
jgi:ribosome-associated translation inhibitor RaiA